MKDWQGQHLTSIMGGGGSGEWPELGGGELNSVPPDYPFLLG